MKNKTHDLPLVTIITPTLDHGRFLESALQSVKNQTYPHIEHLVFDGGSQDNTIDLLKSYRPMYNMQWISEKDNGISEAINKGIQMAKGEIIAWLNADDVLMYEDSIERVVEVYRAKDAPGIILGDMAFLEKSGNIIQMYGYPEVTYEYLISSGKNIGQPSVFIRSDILKNNLLDNDLHYAMDFDLWIRIAKNSRFTQIHRVLSGSRMYPGTKSSNTEKYTSEKEKILKRYGHEVEKRSRLSLRMENMNAFKIRGLWLLLLHRYILRSKIAADVIRYRTFPKDIIFQLFRKMRENYETYWPSYFAIFKKKQ